MNDFNGYKIALGCILFLGAIFETLKAAKATNKTGTLIAGFVIIWLIRSVMGVLLFFA
jgi:hypothetical protein